MLSLTPAEQTMKQFLLALELRVNHQETARKQMCLCPERRGNRFVQRRGGGKLRTVTIQCSGLIKLTLFQISEYQ